MKNKTTILTIIALIIIILFIYFNRTPKEYDEFARCLTSKDVKMYGASWCSHCQNQKNTFGKSWDYINYVECSLPDGNGQTAECQAAGIKAYPTWEFGDGSRISGEVKLEQLSSISRCQIAENK